MNFFGITIFSLLAGQKEKKKITIKNENALNQSFSTWQVLLFTLCPWEKISPPGHHPDRNGCIMVSPENLRFNLLHLYLKKLADLGVMILQFSDVIGCITPPLTKRDDFAAHLGTFQSGQMF